MNNNYITFLMKEGGIEYRKHRESLVGPLPAGLCPNYSFNCAKQRLPSFPAFSFIPRFFHWNDAGSCARAGAWWGNPQTSLKYLSNRLVPLDWEPNSDITIPSLFESLSNCDILTSNWNWLCYAIPRRFWWSELQSILTYINHLNKFRQRKKVQRAIIWTCIVLQHQLCWFIKLLWLLMLTNVQNRFGASMKQLWNSCRLDTTWWWKMGFCLFIALMLHLFHLSQSNHVFFCV